MSTTLFAVSGCENRSSVSYTPSGASIEIEQQPIDLAPFGEASLSQRSSSRPSDSSGDLPSSVPTVPTAESSLEVVGGIIQDQLAAIPKGPTTFDEVVQVDNASFDRALAAFQQGKVDEAITEGSKAIAQNPDDVRGYELMGLCYSAKGEFSRAVANFDAAIRRQPNAAGLYVERGSTYIRLRRNTLAVSDLTKAVELAPDNLAARVWRSVANLNSQRLREAIDDATVALKMNDKIADAYFIRCLAYLQSGRIDDARRDYEAAVPLGLDENSRKMVEGVFAKK
ncbi:MAG TPA: tetratricopeptide repeat protein [Pirellulales bacterium]|nr:tetratricopeptide repeat protein [Pirellulales bacterium]